MRAKECPLPLQIENAILERMVVACSNAKSRSCSSSSRTRRYIAEPCRLTFRLSDARMRCREAKLIYTNHRPPPWLTECSSRWLGGDLNIVDTAGRRGNRSAVFTQTIQVKFDGLANSLLRSRKRFTSSYAAWEIRHVRGVITTGVFDDNCVAHDKTLFLQSRLLEDTVQSARCQIVAWFSRHRHTTRLTGVLELAMTTSCRYQVPTVLTADQAQYVSYLHSRSRLPKAVKAA